MTDDAPILDWESAGTFAATLDPAEPINGESGFDVAGSKTILISAEPKTVKARLNSKLGDGA